MRHVRSPVAAWIESAPSWLRVEVPTQTIDDFELDEGERAAIALAVEVNADFLRIDERRGREAATRRGLKVAVTLAVVVDAANRGLCDGLAAIDRLERSNFYASSELLAQVRAMLKS
ncbi:MAG TPA: hypothetical protein VF175_09250 [Lacipirellula sp.]